MKSAECSFFRKIIMIWQDLLILSDKVRRGLDSPSGSQARRDITSKIEQASIL